MALNPLLVAKGLALGWSVAWPPGPINAEMIRRGLSRGALRAYAVGVGACTGDFLWALAVALGAGALVRGPRVHLALGMISLALLLWLGFSFLRGALRSHRGESSAAKAPVSARRGYLLGLSLALSGPWNIAFWMAVLGTQETLAPAASLLLAAAVVVGALAWGAVLCTAVHFGARFATPAWDVLTQLATGLLMLAFAVRLALRLSGG